MTAHHQHFQTLPQNMSLHSSEDSADLNSLMLSDDDLSLLFSTEPDSKGMEFNDNLEWILEDSNPTRPLGETLSMGGPNLTLGEPVPVSSATSAAPTSASTRSGHAFLPSTVVPSNSPGRPRSTTSNETQFARPQDVSTAGRQKAASKKRGAQAASSSPAAKRRKDSGKATSPAAQIAHAVKSLGKPSRTAASPRDDLELEFDDEDFAKDSIMSPEEEQELREQLKVKQAELEECVRTMGNLTPPQKKRVRNRHASCVSRLKKKLYICGLQRQLQHFRDDNTRLALENEALKQQLQVQDAATSGLQHHQ